MLKLRTDFCWQAARRAARKKQEEKKEKDRRKRILKRHIQSLHFRPQPTLSTSEEIPKSKRGDGETDEGVITITDSSSEDGGTDEGMITITDSSSEEESMSDEEDIWEVGGITRTHTKCIHILTHMSHSYIGNDSSD